MKEQLTDTDWFDWEPSVNDKIEEIRDWTLTADFAAAMYPDDLEAQKSYRTDSTDRKVINAILDYAKSKGMATLIVSARAIAANKILDKSTVDSSIQRLGGWFANVEKVRSKLGGYKLTILEPRYMTNCNQILHIGIGESSCSSASIYNELNTKSVFARGVSQLVKREATAEGIEVNEYIDSSKLRSLPELAAQVTAILNNLSDGLTITRLAELTGKSEAHIRNVLPRMTEYELIEVTGKEGRKSIYSLRSDWRQRLEENEIRSSTYCKSEEKESERLLSSIVLMTQQQVEQSSKGLDTTKIKNSIASKIDRYAELQVKQGLATNKRSAYRVIDTMHKSALLELQKAYRQMTMKQQENSDRLIEEIVERLQKSIDEKIDHFTEKVSQDMRFEIAIQNETNRQWFESEIKKVRKTQYEQVPSSNRQQVALWN